MVAIPSFIRPEWPAPDYVAALSTTRIGGVSLPPWDSLNLAQHVSDARLDVEENRRRLRHYAQLPAEPCWLEQVHGTTVITDRHPLFALSTASTASASSALSVFSTSQADAIYSAISDRVCLVMTADCLPVLFCSTTHREVAAAHAGWRGLCDGVLENTLQHFQADPADIMAWLGPAIGPGCFEVGAEVREKFVSHDKNAVQAFIDHGEKFLADIYALARQRLQAAGIRQIYGGEHCTFSDPQRFFSYRRDSYRGDSYHGEKNTGRMASLIWLTSSP